MPVFLGVPPFFFPKNRAPIFSIFIIPHDVGINQLFCAKVVDNNL